MMMISPKKQLYFISFFIILLDSRPEECMPTPQGGGVADGGGGGGDGGGTATTTTAPTTTAPPPTTTCPANDPTGVQGINTSPGGAITCAPCDGVTPCQGFNWPSAFNQGYRYVSYGITQGSGLPQFAAVGSGAGCQTELQAIKNANLLVSPQHRARPNENGGADQATFFVNNGGRWTNDGRTLPGTLHMEFANNGCTDNSGTCCYSMTPQQLQQWVLDFNNQYQALTGRDVTISTDVPFWRSCMANWNGATDRRLQINFDCMGPRNANCPIDGLPWTMETFWGDKTIAVNDFARTQMILTFQGTLCQLQRLATNT